CARAVEAVEVRAERIGLRRVANRIVAGVAAEIAHGAAARVAPCAKMQLLGPAAVGIEVAEELHHERGKPLGRIGRSRLTGARPIESRRSLRLRTGADRTPDEAVVRQPPAGLVKGLMAAP